MRAKVKSTARAKAASPAARAPRSTTSPRRAKPAVKTPKRRVRLETDERRAQLLALARRVFTERAYDDVAIEDIAAAAGISKGLLYHYFPTKRDLYVAGLRETADELVASVTAAIDHERPPAERVRAGLSAYLTYVRSTGPGFVALMRGGVGSDPEVASMIERVRRAFLDEFLVRSPMAQAFASDPLIRLAMRGWIGMVEATSIEWVSQPTVALPRLCDLLVDNVLAVLANARKPAA
jgi:AcrR family transcriptional regulator